MDSKGETGEAAGSGARPTGGRPRYERAAKPRAATEASMANGDRREP
ncbi:hypothetical protein [Natronomonas marina]|nr:hypothetical protein [Natronomonas marina]